MVIPVINLEELNENLKTETTRALHEACVKWGFFWVENHGIDKDLMEKVKRLVNQHYEQNLKEKFYISQLADEPDSRKASNDWERSVFIPHKPDSNINDIPNLNGELREVYSLTCRQY